MPSPVGHALAGLTVHVLSARDATELRSVRRALLLVGAATAPDLDLLFRFIDGRNHHQAETHSIGAAALAAVVVWAATRLRHWPRPAALGLVTGCAWLSHVLLDYVGLDTHPPIGIMALWPFERGFHKAPWTIFLDIGRTLEWATVRHNALAMAWEVVLLGPLLLASWRLRTRSEA
jgi:inner membrane protein